MDEKKKEKRFAKPAPTLPLWRRPSKDKEDSSLIPPELEEEWLEGESKATEWLSLFYGEFVFCCERTRNPMGPRGKVH